MNEKLKSNSQLGILAGSGELPWIAARNAIEMGEDPIIFNLTNQEPSKDFRERTVNVILTKFYTSVLKTLKKYKIKRLISLGKIPKTIIYEKPKFDIKTMLLLAKMHNKNDYTIFLYLNDILEKNGITVLPQTSYLSNCFLDEGRYGRKLTKREIEDISYGMFYAMEVNRLDIGQCVVVGDKVVWAVECAEGTDECIKRGGNLFKKGGGVVCKVAKVDHDPRYDIPVIGTHTLDSMREAHCSVLAIESKGTIVVNKEIFLKKAHEYDISVLSIESDLTNVKRIEAINKNQRHEIKKNKK